MSAYSQRGSPVRDPSRTSGLGGTLGDSPETSVIDERGSLPCGSGTELAVNEEIDLTVKRERK